MEQGSVFLWGLLLLCVALVGCVGDDRPMDTEGAAGDGDAATQIVGQVMTVDLDPVGNARVVVSSEGQMVAETRSDDQGEFRFTDVEAGEYRMQATSPCCRESIQGVQIVDQETTRVSFLLQRFTEADLRERVMVHYEWQGFLSCAVGSAVVATGQCGNADPNNSYIHEFIVGEGLKELVIGMEWEDAGVVSAQSLQIFVENAGCDVTGCSQTYGSAEGESPIIFTVTSPGGEWAFGEIDGERDLQFRVFSTFETQVIFQQPFTVHYWESRYQDAPANFNPIPDS